LTYYQVRDYNNITSITVSNTSGFESRLVNGNEYKRKGIEIVLTSTPVRGDDFQWNLTTNLSQYRRYLTDIYGEGDRLGFLKEGDRTDRIYDWTYRENGQGETIYQSNGFPKWESFQRFI